MNRKDTIKTLSQCIGLLSIDGQGTKAIVREKLIALRESMEENGKSTPRLETMTKLISIYKKEDGKI